MSTPLNYQPRRRRPVPTDSPSLPRHRAVGTIGSFTVHSPADYRPRHSTAGPLDGLDLPPTTVSYDPETGAYWVGWAGPFATSDEADRFAEVFIQ